MRKIMWESETRKEEERRKQERVQSEPQFRSLTISLISPIFDSIAEMQNMEGPYGSEWPSEEKIKHREMVSVEARYIFVYEISDEKPSEGLESKSQKKSGACDEAIVAFVHYRFVLEEEVPVVYVYELQLEPHVQGKGLGQFLMQLIELIAQKNGMGAVMLTVQKTNLSATSFYTDKLGYSYQVSSISPSRGNAEIRTQKSYEILCKTFDGETKAVLEA